ncbi:hypothetical protein [Pseudofrankia sp. DC12]|uniref:hypothetical protein n=1 Tax=Pseudofrankia sp. DC12 TaxID=683315 RepID=UPI000696B146|nr:hypothetical protein [Pseudofrankia sp. DC12]
MAPARSTCPTSPGERGLPQYSDPRYDPLWARLQGMRMPVCVHLGVSDATWDIAARDPTPRMGDFVEVGCGGAPMIGHSETPAAGLAADPAQLRGSPLGKRFVIDGDTSLELLVTRGGKGSLTAGGVALVEKETARLPSSDLSCRAPGGRVIRGRLWRFGPRRTEAGPVIRFGSRGVPDSGGHGLVAAAPSRPPRRPSPIQRRPGRAARRSGGSPAGVDRAMVASGPNCCRQ